MDLAADLLKWRWSFVFALLTAFPSFAQSGNQIPNQPVQVRLLEEHRSQSQWTEIVKILGAALVGSASALLAAHLSYRHSLKVFGLQKRQADEAWNRDWEMRFKKEVYIRLMEDLGEAIDAERMNKRLGIKQRRTKPKDELFVRERDRAMDRHHEVHARLVRSSCAATLIVANEAHDLISAIASGLKDVNYDSDGFEADCDHNINRLTRGVSELLAVAKKDLASSKPKDI